jgi:uncharacterized protein involved in exopolysaccharide biosynthesis
MTRYERVPEPPETRHYPDDEIDLRELFATLWVGKWIVILVTILFAASGVAYALYKPDIYQANALLAPADGDNSGRLGGQLGSLASLAGVNISEDGSSNTVIAKEVLQSRVFLTDFIRRRKHGIFDRANGSITGKFTTQRRESGAPMKTVRAWSQPTGTS